MPMKRRLPHQSWTYEADSAQDEVQALGADDVVTDTFTVTSIDGTEETIDVTINGANDAAVISGETTATVTEDDAELLTAGGTLTVAEHQSKRAFMERSAFSPAAFGPMKRTVLRMKFKRLARMILSRTRSRSPASMELKRQSKSPSMVLMSPLPLASRRLRASRFLRCPCRAL